MEFISSDNQLTHEKYIIYFYASWMPQHNKMLKMISSIEDNYIKFKAVDVDVHKNICKQYKIDSIPTLLVLNNKKEISRTNGILLMSAFKNFIKKNY